MGRRLAVVAFAVAMAFSAGAEEKPQTPDAKEKGAPRKSIVIAGGWILTAGKLEKTKGEGGRTVLLTATGAPTLKRTTKLIGGRADITGKAGKIECDFSEKKLILSGSPEFRQVELKTKAPVKTVVGEAGAVIEIPLRYGAEGNDLKVTGPVKAQHGDESAPVAK